MSDRYFTWGTINALRSGAYISEEKLLEMLRSKGSIYNKIKSTVKLTGSWEPSLDKFIKNIQEKLFGLGMKYYIVEKNNTPEMKL